MKAPPLARVDFDPECLHPRLRVQIAGRLEAISPAVERMMVEVRAMECSRGKEFEIETALREAIANAVRHGCGNDATKEVEAWACDEARMIARGTPARFDREIPSVTVGHIFCAHGRHHHQPAHGRGPSEKAAPRSECLRR
jgi:hypothetical protein